MHFINHYGKCVVHQAPEWSQCADEFPGLKQHSSFFWTLLSLSTTVVVTFLFHLVWAITCFKHSKVILQHICPGSWNLVILVSSVSWGSAFILLNSLLYPTLQSAVSPCSGHLGIQSHAFSDMAYQCWWGLVAPLRYRYFLVSWSNIPTIGFCCDFTLVNSLVISSGGESKGDTLSYNAKVSALSSNKKGALYFYKEWNIFIYKEWTL